MECVSWKRYLNFVILIVFWSNERKHSFNVPRVVECLDMMGVLVKFIFISV